MMEAALDVSLWACHLIQSEPEQLSDSFIGLRVSKEPNQMNFQSWNK